MSKVHFLIALHNHQPVGNFDTVFEQTCADAYQPFLEELRRHPDIRMTLHYSGSLLEWIEHNRPSIIDRIRELVQAGQVEIMGGGYYEPILTMVPDRDKIGQIRTYADHLQELFQTPVRGYWLTERVWEQALTRPLVDAGAEYTIVDDTHFKYAGLTEEELTGYYVTEDDGRVLRLFAGSETLRYCIPFGEPSRTTEYLEKMNTARDALVAYADDGEKFGVWPKTHQHVYTDGWLARFFEELERNRDRIDFLTFGEAIDRFKPKGKVYLPDASYREMTEWALPARALVEYNRTVDDLKENSLYERARLYMRGGFWRNFKVKYPESNAIYSRMMHVSRKVQDIEHENPEAFQRARAELYRGQCNCAYWHGVFGGLYLPHLRHALYEHLIEAENIVDEARGRKLEALQYDFDTDGCPEVCLSNAKLAAVIKPDRGGHVTEFDVRSRNANLLGGLSRRFEAYHNDITNPPEPDEGGVASIHDIVVAKEPGLEKLLHYDWYQREGFIDHFLLPDVDLGQMMTCNFVERGDFVVGQYEHILSPADGVARVELSRKGTVWIGSEARAVSLRKVYTLAEGSPELECDYEIQSEVPLEIVFAVECNLAFPGADPEFWNYRLNGEENAGDLMRPQSYDQRGEITVIDRLRGLHAVLRYSRPAAIWAFPIRTVSQSESGFEGVFQSSAIVARWPLQLRPAQPWQLTITKAIVET